MIKILPQNVANQIAAGEVVQRPASVVKELLENSVDAGATSITLVTQDGGRTLIQVIDDGKGMSAEDALLSFKRHATSKISTADDLFNLHTFGFRGEALASIASVSEVEMKSRRREDTVGTQVSISGGVDIKQQPVSCPAGTSISVRNLFFNTPARRKFLKSDASENRQIILEFTRIVLVNPEIEFKLIMDGRETLQLFEGNLHQRIVALTNKTHGSRLLAIESNSGFANISGYITKPEAARKRSGDQYFFVNGRFMRNPYLQKAVVDGYGKLLAADEYPTFYMYVEVDPTRLDVNIHPTKSEVKFEDEHIIWQVISSAVRQTLGRHNIVPLLDFENKAPIEIPAYDDTREVHTPSSGESKQGYNPFKSYDTAEWESPSKKSVAWTEEDPERVPFKEFIPEYLQFDENGETVEHSGQSENTDSVELPLHIETSFNALQWQKRYVITTSVDGVLIIDYPRAMQRIAYEKILSKDRFASHSQRELHTQVIELSAMDHRLLTDSMDEVAELGFDISDMGGTTIALQAMPVELSGKVSAEEAVEAMIEGLNNPAADSRKRNLAKLITRKIAYTTPKILSPSEISTLINDLFTTDEPSYTPDQLPIIEIINPKEIFK